MLLSSANKNRKRWLFRGIATLHFFHTRTARCRCPNPSGSEALRSAYILAQRVSLGLPVVDGIAISKQLFALLKIVPHPHRHRRADPGEAIDHGPNQRT